jgi:hypothetical protein
VEFGLAGEGGPIRVALRVRPDGFFRQNDRERNISRVRHSDLHPVRCPALGRHSVVESALAPSPLNDPRSQPDIHALVSVKVNDLPAADIEGEPVTVAGFAWSESRDRLEPSFDLSANRHRDCDVVPILRVY